MNTNNRCSAGHDLSEQKPYIVGGRLRCRRCQAKWNRESYARRKDAAAFEAASADIKRLLFAAIQRNAALEGRWIPDEETALLLERVRTEVDA